MPTRGELIAEALDAFLQDCTDVEGAAVVSVDGLPMASALPMHFEEDRLAAMAAALLSLGEKASEGLGRGRLGEVHLEGEGGTVHLMSAGPQAVFCAVCRGGAKTGLVLYEMRTAAERIAQALVAPRVMQAPAPAPAPAPEQVSAPTPAPVPPTPSAAPHAAPRPITQKPPVPVPAPLPPVPPSPDETSTRMPPRSEPQPARQQPMSPVSDLHPVHGPGPS